MDFTETDNTQTNWDEIRLQNQSECCTDTGVSWSLSFPEVEHPDVALLTSQVESARESKLKLQTMFNKFFYQK